MPRVKKSYHLKIINVFRALHKKFPTYNIGRHISTAFEGYGDLWNVTDKEFLFAMEKYLLEQELDIPHKDDEDDINQIINDGLNLDKILRKRIEEDNK
jgi:hypothetical protein